MTDNQHQIIDYKVDNSAIDAGRSSIGLRKRGDKVELKHMTPKEYRHYLYHIHNLNRFKGWNGIEKSDFAHNWQPDESQKELKLSQALKYLNLCPIEHAPDGIENRSNDRRKNNKDIRKDKMNRRISEKERRKHDLTNNITYFTTVFILLISIVSWVSYSVYLYIEGAK